VALSNSVFIDRGNHTSAVAAMNDAANQMRSTQQSVFIFPEGTRSYYDRADMLPFKKGAFHLAIQAQVPIVPVVVANYASLLSIKKKIFRAGTVPVRALKPIETKGMTAADVDDLMAQARKVMLAELHDLHGQTRTAANGSAGLAPKLQNKAKIALSS
jgi:lysophosphatidate acyltransferase